MPSIEAVRKLLGTHWGVNPGDVRPWPKSARMFQAIGHGFARVGFPRGGLTAGQLVELVNKLHELGCAVPGIVPTSSGDLYVSLGEATLSLELAAPGNECSGEDLSILESIGREVGRLHEVLYRSEHVQGHVAQLGGWIDETVAKAVSWATQWHHRDQMLAFQATITDNHRCLRPICLYWLRHLDTGVY